MNKYTIKGYVVKTGDNHYTAIASTNAVDRYGEVVDQNGWMIDSYMKNPVMLWAHDSSQLPVARCLSIDLSVPGIMKHEFEFADETMTPMQPFVKNSYDAGFLNAFSVGFLAHEMQGNTITKAELLEISLVPIPANQEALRLNGYDLGRYKALDFGPIKTDIEKAVADIIKEKENKTTEPTDISTKGGKVLSEKSKSMIEKAIGHLDAMSECYKGISDHMESMIESHENAVSTLGELLESASTSTDGGADGDGDDDGDTKKNITIDALQNIRKALNLTNHQSSLATKMVKDLFADLVSSR